MVPFLESWTDKEDKAIIKPRRRLKTGRTVSPSSFENRKKTDGRSTTRFARLDGGFGNPSTPSAFGPDLASRGVYAATPRATRSPRARIVYHALPVRQGLKLFVVHRASPLRKLKPVPSTTRGYRGFPVCKASVRVQPRLLHRARLPSQTRGPKTHSGRRGRGVARPRPSKKRETGRAQDVLHGQPAAVAACNQRAKAEAVGIGCDHEGVPHDMLFARLHEVREPETVLDFELRL